MLSVVLPAYVAMTLQSLRAIDVETSDWVDLLLCIFTVTSELIFILWVLLNIVP